MDAGRQWGYVEAASCCTVQMLEKARGLTGGVLVQKQPTRPRI